MSMLLRIGIIEKRDGNWVLVPDSRGRLICPRISRLVDTIPNLATMAHSVSCEVAEVE